MRGAGLKVCILALQDHSCIAVDRRMTCQVSSTPLVVGVQVEAGPSPSRKSALHQSS